MYIECNFSNEKELNVDVVTLFRKEFPISDCLGAFVRFL